MNYSNEAGERLRKLRKHRKISQTEAGKAIKYDKQAVYTWEKNRNTPKESVLRELVEEVLGGNLHWVLTGEGEMIKNNSPYPVDLSSPAYALRDRSNGQNNIEPFGSWKNKARKIPVYDVSAGWEYIKSGEEPVGFVECDTQAPGTFAARVNGDSMEPDFKQGEILVVSPLLGVNSWSGYALYFLKNGDSGFKKIVIDDGKVTLIPLNSTYEPLKVKQTDLLQVCELIWHFRKFGKG